MSALTKLQSKYSGTPECASAATVDRSVSDRPDSWRNSASILALSEFLKAHADAGMSLGSSKGCVILHFEPGLSPQDQDRWHAAEQALDLLDGALDDIRLLMSAGVLRLKKIG